MPNENNDVERKLKNAVDCLTPDVLDNILSRCNSNEGNVFIFPPRKPKNNWLRVGGSIAAAFVLVFTGLFAYARVEGGRLDARVILDVNPSIEIEVNKNDRVIDVNAKNEDAVKILDNMDLENTQINVAVNALIGSMLKYGYIKENANSVLLSVDGNNEEKAVSLQRGLSESISRQLNMVNGAVISQQLAYDAETQGLADEHQISHGKAALVQKIIVENSHLLFEDLARLSVNELNLLIASKNIEAAGMEAQGNASDMDFIGEDAAALAALQYAEVNEDETEMLNIELDYDDGMMIYEIEFIYNVSEYEYEINARDGSVIEFDHEQKRERKKSPDPTQSQSDFIGEDRVVEIIESHSGVSDYTGFKIEMEKDDGLYVYEVNFESGGKEYDYEISASTGEIIKWEVDD